MVQRGKPGSAVLLLLALTAAGAMSGADAATKITIIDEGCVFDRTLACVESSSPDVFFPAWPDDRHYDSHPLNGPRLAAEAKGNGFKAADFAEQGGRVGPTDNPATLSGGCKRPYDPEPIFLADGTMGPLRNNRWHTRCKRQTIRHPAFLPIAERCRATFLAFDTEHCLKTIVLPDGDALESAVIEQLKKIGESAAGAQ